MCPQYHRLQNEDVIRLLLQARTLHRLLRLRHRYLYPPLKKIRNAYGVQFALFNKKTTVKR